MADIKISQLPPGASLDGSELFEIVQGGSSFRTTAANIGAYAAAVIPPPPPPPGFANPMTTQGDVIVGESGGTPGRLGVGANGQVLTVSGSSLAWTTPSSGFANPMTSIGDLIAGIASGDPVRIPVGADGQVLTVSSGQPAWVAPSGFTNPMTTPGDVIVGGSGGTANRLGVGSNGQVLGVSGGAPTWVTTAPSSTYSNAVLTDEVTRYYALDDTSGSVAVDMSGNSSNGTYINSPTLNQASMLFNGEGASVDFVGASQQAVAFDSGLGLIAGQCFIVTGVGFVDSSSRQGAFATVVIETATNVFSGFSIGVGDGSTFANPGNTLMMLSNAVAWFNTSAAVPVNTPFHWGMGFHLPTGLLVAFLQGVPVYIVGTGGGGGFTATSDSRLGNVGTDISTAFTGRLQAVAIDRFQAWSGTSGNIAVSMMIAMVRRRFRVFKKGAL